MQARRLTRRQRRTRAHRAHATPRAAARYAPALLLLPVALLEPGWASAPAAARLGTLQAQPARAGQLRVSGVVTASGTGQPVEGVTVRVQGTQIGASTNAQGRYTILARSADDTLVFTRVGSARQAVAVGGRTQIDVSLQAVAVSLQAVAVLGYQAVPTEKLTGAVGTVSPAQIQAQAVVQNSPIKALQGRIAGVTLTSTGNPEDLGQVRIRGYNTLSGNANDPKFQPLYVIDGIPSQSTAAQQLKPQDIETIDVLKDAATASIYGSRASNGVIVITTRSGARQRSQVSVGSHLTASNYGSHLSVLNTEQRGQALWQAAVNDGIDPNTVPVYKYDWTRDANGVPVLNKVIVPKWVGDSSMGILASNTDWFQQVTRTGLIQEHTLQANTSGDRGAALLSLGYYDNNGLVKETNFRRFNGRINSSYSFFDRRFTVGENLSLNHASAVPLPSGLGGTPLDNSLNVQPILPVHTVSGGWAGPPGAGFDDRDNPVMLLALNSWNRNTSLQGIGNVFANYAVTPNLQATARFGLDYQNGDNTNIARRYQAGFLSRNINSLNDYGYNTSAWTFNSTLNYNRQFGPHNVRLLGGFEAVKSSASWVTAYHEGYAIETQAYFTQNAGTGIQTVAGSDSAYALASFFGKVDYDFADKYLATFTLRDDGSSRFGSNNRFGLFPSFTLGWRVSKEPFFRSSRLLTDLKLRYGYGETGNQAIPNSAQYSLYVPGYGFDNTWNPNDGTAYDIRGQNTGTLPSGFFRTQTGNPNLRWEATKESNGGLDYSLFGGHVNGSFDAFARTTSNILITPPYAAVIGNGGSQTVNGATLKVRGVEFSSRYDRQAGALTWGLGVNLGSFSPRITSLPQSVVGSYPGNGFQNILGRSPNSIFGYVVQGIFQDSNEVNNSAVQPGKNVGRLRYADLNGDGKIDALDQKYLGTTDSKLDYGINPSVTYRRVSLSLLFQGRYGADVYNGIKAQTDFTSNFTGANFGTRVLQAWTPQNRNSTIPALSLSNTNNEFRGSSYFVESGNYLKLREVVLGYTLPQNVPVRGLSVLNGARAFVRAGNLFTVKGNTTLPDPELPFGAYPLPRTFTFGLDVSY
ncbi:SusC/RagA family TonB-linked outer membrane protein [Gemmatimonadetes bacterium T265]|nr:SusC/RagA family TonB-linked outer membrane protein [Gemmatimonadetes bacterium T265]